jgi:hypothetical protein
VTTIACDGKSMAGDGLAARGSLITAFNSEKVVRLDDGRIVGTAGNKADCYKFRAWLRDGGPIPKFKDFAALVLQSDGRLSYHTEDYPAGSPTEAPNAIGTGQEIAIGAMLAGKTPAEAVTLAAMRDIHTGGVIISYDIAPSLQVAA